MTKAELHVVTSAKPARGILALITALTALGSISVSIYLPSLPQLASDMQATQSLVRLSLTAFLFVFAGAQLAYGPLSDRFGRRMPILVGLAIYLVGTVLCALATNISMLVAARLIQGLGAAAGPALGRAILRDLYSGQILAGSLATVAAAVALSPMLGPVLGGYLQVAFGWRACFYFLVVSAIILAAGTLRILPETNANKAADGLKPLVIARNYLVLLKDQEYVAALMCGGMLTAGNFAWTAGAPFIFSEIYHFAPDQYGNVALLVGGGYLAGTILSGQLSRRMTAPSLVYGGMALTILASVVLYLLAGANTPYAYVVAPMIFYTAGMGIVIPMSAACALSRHPNIAGASAGLLGAAQIVTGALGTVLVGLTGASGLTISMILFFTSLMSLMAAYIALLPFRGAIVAQPGRSA